MSGFLFLFLFLIYIKHSFSQTNLVLTTRGHQIPFSELKYRAYSVSKWVLASPSKICHGDLDVSYDSPSSTHALCQVLISVILLSLITTHWGLFQTRKLAPWVNWLKAAHLGCVTLKLKLLPPRFLPAEHTKDSDFTSAALLCPEHHMNKMNQPGMSPNSFIWPIHHQALRPSPWLCIIVAREPNFIPKPS